jgi:hypothetical protein
MKLMTEIDTGTDGKPLAQDEEIERLAPCELERVARVVYSDSLIACMSEERFQNETVFRVIVHIKNALFF